MDTAADKLNELTIAGGKEDLPTEEGSKVKATAKEETVTAERKEGSTEEESKVKATAKEETVTAERKEGSTEEETKLNESPKNELVPGDQQVDKQPKEIRRYVFKVLILGYAGVGKTTITQTYTNGLKSDNLPYKSTIGVEFSSKIIEREDCKIKLNLYDVGGQERSAFLTRPFYRHSTGAVLVYDCTNPLTLEIVAEWAKELQKKVVLPNGEPIPCIMMANKVDAIKHRPSPDEPIMVTFFKEHDILKMFFTSAVKNENLDESFDFLIQKMIESTDQHYESDEDLLNVAEVEEKSVWQRCTCS